MSDTLTRLIDPGFARLERREKHTMDDELGPAPCPHCGYSLVARVGAAGPYFFCLCVERRDRAASRIVRETA
ncbi:MAG: hypothetical protein U0793_14860 [Gemmataceae bacterium]